MPSLTAAQCDEIIIAGYETKAESGCCCHDCDPYGGDQDCLAYRIDCIAISTFGPPSFYTVTDPLTGFVTTFYSLDTEGI